MHASSPRWTFAALAAAALLAACGGGSSYEAPPQVLGDPTIFPASAVASVDSFVAYTAGLAEDDQREPLVVEGAVPPTSETAEPAPVTRG